MKQCDFCGKANPPWEIPAKDTYLGTIEAFNAKEVHAEHHYSLGAWAACNACAEFIRANDRNGLRQRCLQIVSLKYPEMHIAALAEGIDQCQDAFWAAKVGEPVLESDPR